MSGTIGAIEIRVGQKPTLVAMEDDLDAYQKFVGGYIETLSFRISDMPQRHFQVIFDEEGKLKSLPTNLLATLLLADTLQHSDIISGDALIVGETDMYGNFTSATPDDHYAILQKWALLQDFA